MNTGKLSLARLSVPLIAGLQLLHRGKVRDTYAIPGHPDKLLVIATNGLSIFDFVLNALVEDKGAVLTAMNHFWLTKLEEMGIKTHMIAAGAKIDQYLPEELRGNAELQKQAMVVKKLTMIPVEFVARGELTGSGLTSYQSTGTVCGHVLPQGLRDGDDLIHPIDTPTTKAEEGHDEPLDAAEIRKKYPEETALLLQIYTSARGFMRQYGIIIADTKIEFGRDEEGTLYVADEVFTPDSSRFWSYEQWVASRLMEKPKAPPPYDKQLVRNAGIKEGINKLDPSRPEDIAKAHSWWVPPALLEATTATYRYIFWRLTGVRLEKYQSAVLGINVAPRRRHLTIVFGSKNDIPKVKESLEALLAGEFDGGIERVRAHIISCHRNPTDLANFTNGYDRVTDVVIAVGSKAFALPGVMDAQFHNNEHNTPVIGVALGKEGGIDLQTARLSISELPGAPVVMDEVNKRVYSGERGLRDALHRVAFGELPPPQERKEVPAEFDIKLHEYL